LTSYVRPNIIYSLNENNGNKTMGKATKKSKTEFCNIEAFDIFTKCIKNGSIKLNGKLYSITSLNDCYSNEIVEEYHHIHKMKQNPAFYTLDYAKYDANFDKLVVDQILSKDVEFIKNNYLDVLASLLIHRNVVEFELSAIDNSKTVILWFTDYELWRAIMSLMITNIKSQFIEILGDDEYSEYLDHVYELDIEKLYSLTNADFLNKTYKTEFLKCFISLVAKHIGSSKFYSYHGYGVSRPTSETFWKTFSFDYENETLFFTTVLTAERIGISFANNEIKFIVNDDLSKFAIESIEKLENKNYISKMFTSGKHKIEKLLK
jgi:hypothetical protein